MNELCHEQRVREEKRRTRENVDKRIKIVWVRCRPVISVEIEIRSEIFESLLMCVVSKEFISRLI